jgi:5-methylcytosine-specific restriction endonuclease McrA
VKDRLGQRRQCRRSRRQRHTRYRPARFLNRHRRKGWLPPSLESRIQNILTWVRRLQRVAPVRAISQELVKFDLQALEHPEISGIEYQQGTLAGYEIRQYLLEEFHHRCVYCGATGVPLEVEHIIPRSRPGSSNRIGNLTIACHPCNQAKDQLTAAEFGHPEVQALAARPLADAAAVNATRWALLHRLEALGVPVEVGSGGRTKWNRTQRGLPKTHWLDAACVGVSTPETLRVEGVRPLLVRATGRHSRQMCRTQRVWVSRQGAQSHQCGGRIADWGHRAGADARDQRQGGGVHRPHCGTRHGVVQRYNGGWDCPGHPCALLHPAPPRRWLYLQAPARSGGHFSPGLQAGVSWPHNERTVVCLKGDPDVDESNTVGADDHPIACCRP